MGWRLRQLLLPDLEGLRQPLEIQPVEALPRLPDRQAEEVVGLEFGDQSRVVAERVAMDPLETARQRPNILSCSAG